MWEGKVRWFLPRCLAASLQNLEAGTVTFSLARLPECRTAALTLDTGFTLNEESLKTNSTAVLNLCAT
jgi:hypothetical protein